MTALKMLTRLLAGITPGSSFTATELAVQIKLNLDRVLTGHMDRESFERRVFDFTNLAELPIGHLQDQRVHMPEDMAAELLLGRQETLSMLLCDMLCSTHPQGAELVAEALGLDTFDDAHRLQSVNLINSQFVKLCLTGYHGLAFPMLSEAGDRMPDFRETFISTAIYYGALQHQLIGSRLRAISEFHFAVDDGELTDTMGATVNDFRQLFSSLAKANEGVNSDKKLLGRRPDLITLVKPFAENILAETYRLRPRLTEEALLEELRELYGSLWPFIHELSLQLGDIPKEYDFDETSESTDSGEREGEPASDLAGLRQRVSTALSGGTTAGQQLAFASLRLHAFSKRLRRLMAEGNKLPKAPEDWFAPLAGYENIDVAKLVLVSTSAVWAKTQHFRAFSTDGSLDDLQRLLHISQGKPNVDLLRETKKVARAWPQRRVSTSADEPLRGHETWDIIPEFHLAHLPSARRKSQSRNLGYEIGRHKISPQHRAPRASHRFC